MRENARKKKTEKREGERKNKRERKRKEQTEVINEKSWVKYGQWTCCKWKMASEIFQIKDRTSLWKSTQQHLAIQNLRRYSFFKVIKLVINMLVNYKTCY